MYRLVPVRPQPSSAGVTTLVTALVLLHGLGGHGGSTSILQTMPTGLASLHNGVATFVRQGAALGNQSSQFEAKVGKMCHCKSLCWSNYTCTAFSYSSDDGQCAIGQDHEDFVTSPSSTIVFRVKVPEMGGKREDDLYYFLIKEKVLVTSARSRCEQMPGFRLAIARTNQTLNVIKSFEAPLTDVVIDLIKETPQSDLMWGDRSPVDPTIFIPEEPDMNNDGIYFSIWNGYVDDLALHHLYINPLCQANFDQIDW